MEKTENFSPNLASAIGELNPVALLAQGLNVAQSTGQAVAQATGEALVENATEAAIDVAGQAIADMITDAVTSEPIPATRRRYIPDWDWRAPKRFCIRHTKSLNKGLRITIILFNLLLFVSETKILPSR